MAVAKTGPVVPVTRVLMDDWEAMRRQHDLLMQHWIDTLNHPRSRWPEGHPNYHGPRESERFCRCCGKPWEDD